MGDWCRVIRVDYDEAVGINGLNAALRFPYLLRATREWPWCCQGSTELLLTFIETKGDPDRTNKANYIQALLHLGDKSQIFSVQKLVDQDHDLLGFIFTKVTGQELKVYLVEVGLIWYGDYRDRKYVINHKCMAMTYQGKLYAMCLK